MQFDQLRRREFITLLGGVAVVWPCVGRLIELAHPRSGLCAIFSPGRPDPRHGGRFRVTSSRTGAKSRKHGLKSRSTGTKVRTRIGRGRNAFIELEKQLEARTRELAEAREQQTATSEVLKVISSSLRELEPVLQSILANAMRICDAKFGIMFEYSDGTYRSLSSLGVPQQYEEHCRQKRIWGRDTLLGRVARTKKTVHIADVRSDRAYLQRNPDRVAAVELTGQRTAICVPMLKGNGRLRASGRDGG